MKSCIIKFLIKNNIINESYKSQQETLGKGSTMIDPIMLLFVLGIVIKLLFRDFHVPSLVHTVISTLVLVTIGLKGGIELASWASIRLALQMVAVLLLSMLTYLVAKLLLRHLFRYDQENSLIIAAHYGSVSVTTFAICSAIIQREGIFAEPYLPLFVALMEVPAVLIASIELRRLHPEAGTLIDTVKRAVTCKSILLLLISIIVGVMLSGPVVAVIKWALFDHFRILLAALLLEMGVLVGDEFSVIKKHAVRIIATSVALSISCGFCGVVFGMALGLSQGGVIMLTVLAAGASYIAVPAVLRKQTSSARISFALGHALGVTFPFNIFIGIHLYTAIIAYLFA